MVCEHLIALEQQMLSAGLRETYRGSPWTEHCREWVYFDCLIDCAAVRQAIELPTCVRDHAHLGTHDGAEAGLVCSQCHDALMGVHPTHWRPPTPVFGGSPAQGSARNPG